LACACLVFVNLPTYITLTRIFSIPVLIWILSSNRFSSANGERELLACFVFIAASITDAIDGYLARRRAQVTTMGTLLDPVADKLLIAAAFVTLVQFNPAVVPAWMAVIIIGREFLVSGLRSIAASEGFAIQASDLAKLKTFVQIVSVVAAIIDHHWAYLPWYFLHIPVRPVALASIWVMVALSLWSAADYFIAFWKTIDQRAVRRRKKRSFVLSRRRKRNDVPVV
jgi:CDP-diacylglycerol---glycerol-3-phosphate 3-phosphatidyltransferase